MATYLSTAAPSEHAPYDVQHTVPFNVWKTQAGWRGGAEGGGAGGGRLRSHSSSLGPAPKSNLFTSLSNTSDVQTETDRFQLLQPAEREYFHMFRRHAVIFRRETIR